MKELLQRRPLGLPLHGTATQFALVFALGGLILDIVAWLGLGAANTTGINVGAYALLVATIIAVSVAVLAAAAEALDLDEEDRQSGWLYAGLLALVVVLTVANAILRSTSLRDQVVPPIPLFLSLATLVVLAFATWLGGQLAVQQMERDIEEELQEEEPTPMRRRRRR